HHLGRPDADRVAVLENDRQRQARAVHVRAVGTAEVDEEKISLSRPDQCMPPRHRRIIKHHVVERPSAERGLPVESDSNLLPVWSLNDQLTAYLFLRHSYSSEAIRAPICVVDNQTTTGQP